MAEPGVQTSVWAPEDHMLSMPQNAKPSVNHQAQTKKIEQDSVRLVEQTNKERVTKVMQDKVSFVEKSRVPLLIALTIVPNNFPSTNTEPFSSISTLYFFRVPPYILTIP